MSTTINAVTLVFLIAVALNYPWELLQSGLFTAASHAAPVWLHCFIASLGDGVMVLLLFGLGWLVLGHRDWFVRPRVRGYAFLLSCGAIVAVLVESVAVYVLRRWTYTDAMPVLPGTPVGVVPVLQMILLPPVVFRVAAALRRS
jgi:hypothetical protein